MHFLRTVFGMTFVSILAISASCGVAGDDPRDDLETQATEEIATPAEAPVAVPEALQIAPALKSCKSKMGVCIALRLCNEQNDHHPVPASGCSSTTVCCVAG
jgi:hypothetical protein